MSAGRGRGISRRAGVMLAGAAATLALLLASAALDLGADAYPRPSALSWSQHAVEHVLGPPVDHGGQDANLPTNLSSPGTIAGRLTANGLAAAGVTLTLRLDSAPLQPLARTATDGTGHYTFTNVAAPPADGSAYEVVFDNPLRDPRYLALWISRRIDRLEAGDRPTDVSFDIGDVSLRSHGAAEVVAPLAFEWSGREGLDEVHWVLIVERELVPLFSSLGAGTRGRFELPDIPVGMPIGTPLNWSIVARGSLGRGLSLASQTITFGTPPGISTQARLSDDFSDQATGWPTGRRTNYEALYVDGEYQLTGLREGAYVPVIHDRAQTPGNFDLSVTGRAFGGAGGAYGLTTRWRDGRHYYIFMLQPADGSVVFGKASPASGLALLLGSGRREFIHADQPNRLRVASLGPVHSLLVNDRLAISMFDAEHTAGAAGLAIMSPEQPFTARFDDFSLGDPIQATRTPTPTLTATPQPTATPTPPGIYLPLARRIA